MQQELFASNRYSAAGECSTPHEAYVGEDCKYPGAWHGRVHDEGLSSTPSLVVLFGTVEHELEEL
jgi:hypothetical protein